MTWIQVNQVAMSYYHPINKPSPQAIYRIKGLWDCGSVLTKNQGTTDS